MFIDPRPRQVYFYADEFGHEPALDFIRALRDPQGRKAIRQCLARLRRGHVGDWESLGKGLFEARIHVGPGYRLYFGLLGDTLVVILLAGSKRTQDHDIQKAKENWGKCREGA